MTHEKLMENKARILKMCKEAAEEAYWFAAMLEMAVEALEKVQTEEDARKWQDVYGYMDADLKHVKMVG